MRKISKLKRTLATVAISVAVLSTGTSAYSACYIDRFVPMSLGCTGSDGNSADFVTDCSGGPDQVVHSEVPCPTVAEEPAAQDGFICNGGDWCSTNQAGNSPTGDYYSGTESQAGW